jgi:hypothetical protein
MRLTKAIHSPRRANLTRRLAIGGAFLGLVPATVLSVVRAANVSNPLSAEALLADAVFTLIYLSPYLVAIYSSRTTGAAQATPLLAATTASLVATFFATSSISLVLLPATIVLLVASILAFRDTEGGLAWKAVFSLGAIGAASFIIASFLVLFLRDDARCWQLTKYNDGHTEWQSIAVPRAGAGISLGPAPENATSQEARCSSNVITWPEALGSLGLLVVGLSGLAGFSKYIPQAAPREAP